MIRTIKYLAALCLGVSLVALDVIGVARYQDKVPFRSVDGPSMDCAEFIDHLVNDGQVPKANIEKVVWAPSVTHPFPTRSDVELALQSLMFSPKANLPRKGRRLYLFTAGHCEAPGETEINVLTAESGKIGPVSYPLSKSPWQFTTVVCSRR